VNVVAAAARFVLAGVLGAAAWAKMSDPPGTRQAAREFGVPAAAASAVALVLPVAELTVAVLLVFGGSAAVVGAVGAVLLLSVFIVAIAVSLARGRRPDCHCFGRLRSEAVSPRTLVRNFVLVLLAVVVLAG
jgi:uncharacterized membrane protein YphA (DoxX/SURF4 family)